MSDGKGRGKDFILAGSNYYTAYNFQTAYGYYRDGNSDGTSSDHQTYFENTIPEAPFIIGFALDGYPIYSPYDENGERHEGLDNCNGKYLNG